MKRKAAIIPLLLLTFTMNSCDNKQLKEEMTIKEENNMTMEQFTKQDLYWTHEPKQYTIDESLITITTEPNTDLWQRTYYGFQNDNAPILQMKTSRKDFSFTVKTKFNSSALFDQCGIALYLNSDNWMKASIEYENDEFQRLGSVVTNNGYSDWATFDIPSSIKEMWYRLSRRDSDYYVETSLDGIDFKQMRTFHLFHGGEEISFGIYAASPVDNSFTAQFSDITISDCQWESWSAEESGFSQTEK